MSAEAATPVRILTPGIDRRQRMSATVALAAQEARAVWSYRADAFVGIIGACLRVVLVFAVWQAVFGARSSVAGIDQRVAIGYAVLGALLNLVLQPWQFSSLSSRVAEGTVVFDLIRPLSLVTVSLAQQVGGTLAQLPKAVIGLVVALLVGAVDAPAGWPAAAAFAVSVLLGSAIALLCNLIVAMTAFWTLEIGGALMVYRMAATFCSGALIPLWFMPSGLVSVLRLLPFAAQVFDPLAIYVDPSPGWHTVGTIGIQLFWVLVLFALVQLIWSRAYRRTVINGG